ncbi:MBL fold metallo-hydrolase [Brevibacillus sp. TJ4]|uniref:MBL fold metallo-hydrolase n=1 Tax=Brevibacillus sp. TJ4 TaxID=3234853 RepID=UPI0037D2E27A
MEIQPISDSIYRIPIPVPFPMKYMYSYLVKGKEGWDMIDVGLRYPAAHEAWLAAFASLRIEPQDVRAIYITHFHPDHVGLAGWMQQLTGAPVLISPVDMQMVTNVWGPESYEAALIGQMCRTNGVPEALTSEIVSNMNQLNKSVLPLPLMTPLTDEEVVLGDEQWRVIATPGHSDGHLCFYQPQKRLLICADHIMEKITPNISLWPGCRPNPLDDYLESLKSMSELEVDVALPGHGDLIADYGGRIRAIIAHHDERLQHMYALAKEGRTAYQVAELLFREKELTAHQWRFAMAETLAHLEFLVKRGCLDKSEEKQVVYHAKGKAVISLTTSFV